MSDKNKKTCPLKTKVKTNRHGEDKGRPQSAGRRGVLLADTSLDR